MENVFTVLLFGWAMVALFFIAQLLVLAFTPLDDEGNPNVWHWRRK